MISSRPLCIPVIVEMVSLGRSYYITSQMPKSSRRAPPLQEERTGTTSSRVCRVEARTGSISAAPLAK